jgi:tetratricopeptide (TPR) repeat protein
MLMMLVALVAAPAGAGDKKKDEKKAAPAVKAGGAPELMKEAEARAAAGDATGAIELLKRAAAESGSAEPSLQLGRLLERQLELDLAIDAYQAAAARGGGGLKGEALGRMALLQDLRGMPTEAAQSAQGALAADPEGAWPAIALSRLRAREGKGDEALALARKATSAGAGPAAAALASAQDALGDLAAAENAWKEALAQDPASITAAIGLARTLRRAGRAAEALPLLQKVMDTAPGAVDAYRESALAKLALGRADDALGDASTYAVMAEKDPEALALALQVRSAKALEAVRRGQIDLAIQDLTALRDQNPASASVRVDLGKALIAKRQADAALAELARATEIDPRLAEAHYQLGYVRHVLKGDAAAAVAAYGAAVELDPANAGYRTNLGAALVGAKQFDRALQELNQVTALPGYDRAEAWIYIGQAQVGAKKYRDAIPALEKAISIAPDSDQAYALLGWAYFGLKDAAKFKAAAGKARALGHKEPTLLQYLTRVEGGEPIK